MLHGFSSRYRTFLSDPPPSAQKRVACPFSYFFHFSYIGGGGKRKPPPMHQMRRLREPGKIHQRRRNCICVAVPFCAPFQWSFSGFHLTRPMSAFQATFLNPSLAGILFCLSGSALLPFRFGDDIIPKIRPAGGNFAARDLRRRPIRALSAGRSL